MYLKIKPLMLATLFALIQSLTQTGKAQIIGDAPSPVLDGVIRVFVTTDSSSTADLHVFKVDSAHLAVDNNGLWFETANASTIEHLIYRTPYQQEADLTIRYVEHVNDAGWRREEQRFLLD